jgi:hypothetical protein
MRDDATLLSHRPADRRPAAPAGPGCALGLQPALAPQRARLGWVLCRGLACCPAADPLAPLDRPAPAAAFTLSQRDLDREFVQGEIGGQTFLTFDLRLQPRLAPVFRTSAINPWESASTFRRSSGSVFDAGIREIRSAPPPRDLSLTPL